MNEIRGDEVHDQRMDSWAALRPFAGLPPCTPLPTLAFLQEMERRENANGQQFGQICEPARRLHFQQDLPELQDHLI
jgi:hypothetical protein